MKSHIPANNEAFKTHKSYSPKEILSAGGTTAFGLKTGKNNSKLITALENAPQVEPFTNKEWNDLVNQLEKDK